MELWSDKTISCWMVQRVKLTALPYNRISENCGFLSGKRGRPYAVVNDGGILAALLASSPTGLQSGVRDSRSIHCISKVSSALLTPRMLAAGPALPVWRFISECWGSTEGRLGQPGRSE